MFLLILIVNYSLFTRVSLSLQNMCQWHAHKGELMTNTQTESAGGPTAPNTRFTGHMEKLPERIGGLPISYRAFGILVYSALTGIKISCERLMKRGSEGRDATARAMQELSEHGLTQTSSILVEGKWRRGTMITEKGREYLEGIGLDIYSFKLKGKSKISDVEQDC